MPPSVVLDRWVRGDHLRAGVWGEARAIRCIRGLGYRILFWRYTHPLGEIDLIALDRSELVFVEVKTRTKRSQHYRAVESVDFAKRIQLVRLARAYLGSRQGRRRFSGVRFDVIGVEFDRERSHVEIEHIKGAFDDEGEVW